MRLPPAPNCFLMVLRSYSREQERENKENKIKKKRKEEESLES